jgi:hypothetical protein
MTSLKLLNLKKTKLHLHSIIAKNDTLKSIPVNDETLIINTFIIKYTVKRGSKIKLEVKKYLINKTIVLVAFINKYSL